MSAIDDLVAANQAYAPGTVPAGRPGKQLAVLTCMDVRIDPAAAFGLRLGDAHVLRNAGGLVTEDALRSLVISQRALGTTAIAVVHHTQCGMAGFDDAAFRDQLADETGDRPSWDVPGFIDVEAQARQSLATIRATTWLLHRDDVRAFVFDVATGRLTEVTDQP